MPLKQLHSDRYIYIFLSSLVILLVNFQHQSMEMYFPSAKLLQQVELLNGLVAQIQFHCSVHIADLHEEGVVGQGQTSCLVEQFADQAFR